MPVNWEQLPTINATRVCLRPLTEDDTDDLYRIFSHPEVTRYWAAPPLADRNAALQMVREIQENFRRQAMLKWGIARLTDNVVIGTTTLFNLNLDNGRAEVGYGLDRAHWGNGYVNEALKALLEYAFKEMNLRRIEADIDPRNTLSLRTVERLGFQREGYLRERWNVNGELQDTVLFGLLRKEWEVMKLSGVPS